MSWRSSASFYYCFFSLAIPSLVWLRSPMLVRFLRMLPFAVAGIVVGTSNVRSYRWLRSLKQAVRFVS